MTSDLRPQPADRAEIETLRRQFVEWGLMPDLPLQEQRDYIWGTLCASRGLDCPSGKAARRGYQDQKNAMSRFYDLNPDTFDPDAR